VTVFTLDGDIVKYLYNDRQAAGTYTYFWDGRNLSGDATAQGIYFVRVVGPNMDEIRKVLVVK
jgi:flagellar hook assembly protein FlgD